MLISDYDKGVCTPRPAARDHRGRQRAGMRVIADPIRGDDYRKYHGCSAITPNRLEAGLATGRRARRTERGLRGRRASCARRSTSKRPSSRSTRTAWPCAIATAGPSIFPTRPRQVYDITGAGDMVMSVLGMALAAGADYDAAIRLANVAGGLEVEKIGVATVTRDEILRDLLHAAAATPAATRARCCRSPRCCTNSTTAAGSGSGSPSPTAASTCCTPATCSILRKPGPGRPARRRPQQRRQRAGLKGRRGRSTAARRGRWCSPGLQAVDYVTVFDDATPLELIQAVRPDVLVKGADYRKDEVVGGEFVEATAAASTCADLRDGLLDDEPDRAHAGGVNGRYHEDRGLPAELDRRRGDGHAGRSRRVRDAVPDARRSSPCASPTSPASLDGAPWFDACCSSIARGLVRGAGLRRVARLRRERLDLAVLFPNSFRSGLVAWLAAAAADRRLRPLRPRLAADRPSSNRCRDAGGRLTPSPIIDDYNRLAPRSGARPRAPHGAVHDARRRSRRRRRLAVPSALTVSREMICLESRGRVRRGQALAGRIVRATGPDLVDSRARAASWFCAARANATWPGEIVERRPQAGRRRRSPTSPLSLGLTKALRPPRSTCSSRPTAGRATSPRRSTGRSSRCSARRTSPGRRRTSRRRSTCKRRCRAGRASSGSARLDHRCMNELTPGEVFAALCRLLESKPRTALPLAS